MGLLDFLKNRPGNIADIAGEGINAVGKGLASIPEELVTQGFLARYGKTQPEKEAEAWQTRPNPNMGYEDAQRYGAGRQFAKNWGQFPGAVRGARLIADLLHKPFDSERQELAGQGMEKGLQEYEEENPNKVYQGGGWGKW